MTRRPAILLAACCVALAAGVGFWAGRATAPAPARSPDFWDSIDQARAAQAPASETVYVTRTGTKYHRAGCQYIRNGATACAKNVAQAKGLGPCSKCNP